MAKTRQIGCLYVPDIRLQAHLARGDFRLADRVVAVDAQDTVVVMTPAIRRSGLRPGTSLRQVRASAANLRCIRAAPGLYDDVSQQFATLARSMSPVVEVAGKGLLYLELVGKAGRLPSVFAPLHVRGSVGVGHNKFIARAAAAFCPWPAPLTLVTATEAARWLGAVSIDALPLSGDQRRTLLEGGVCTLGNLRALDIQTLDAVFGGAGRRFLAFAKGVDDRPLIATPVDGPTTAAEDDPVKSDLLSALSDLIGAGGMSVPTLVNDWRPERASGRQSPSHLSSPRQTLVTADAGRPRYSGLRRLRRPTPVFVEISPTLKPESLIGLPVRSPPWVQASVVERAEGPWLLQTAWWEPSGGADRAYFKVRLASRVWVRVHRCALSDAWYLDAIYD